MYEVHSWEQRSSFSETPKEIDQNKKGFVQERNWRLQREFPRIEILQQSRRILCTKENQRPTGSLSVEPVFGVATFKRVLITWRDSKSLTGDTLVFLLGFGAPWSGHVANPTLQLYSSQRKPFVRPILWLFTSTCLLQCLPTKTVQTGFPLEMQAQFTFHVDRARGGCNPVPRFQSQHSRDPLPAGWFYNGVSYVSMTGEKNQHHPCIFYSSCGSRRVETMWQCGCLRVVQSWWWWWW